MSSGVRHPATSTSGAQWPVVPGAWNPSPLLALQKSAPFNAHGLQCSQRDMFGLAIQQADGKEPALEGKGACT